MKFFRNVLLLASFLLSVNLTFGQMPKKVFQLSGLIISKNNQNPVPYAKISVNKTRRGGFANMEGFYSIPVLSTDTVYFSSLGFKSSLLVVSDYLQEYKGDLSSAYIYTINYLEEDSIRLPGMVIFPYNSHSELRTAILETNIPDAIENVNARNNLNPEVMDVLIDNLRVDEGERIMVARQMYYNEQLHKNVAPTATLFDPIAVYQLLKLIHDKTKTRRLKDLDYWTD